MRIFRDNCEQATVTKALGSRACFVRTSVTFREVQERKKRKNNSLTQMVLVRVKISNAVRYVSLMLIERSSSGERWKNSGFATRLCVRNTRCTSVHLAISIPYFFLTNSWRNIVDRFEYIEQIFQIVKNLEISSWNFQSEF